MMSSGLVFEYPTFSMVVSFSFQGITPDWQTSVGALGSLKDSWSSKKCLQSLASERWH